MKENGRNEIVDYHGTPLIRDEYDVLMELENKIGTPLIHDEYDVLMELENKIGRIPQVVQSLGYLFRDNGFIAQDHHIIQIGINRKLTSLPESIGNLTSLIHLNLTENQLTSHLPESIGNLKSLGGLDLSENQLNSLPESLGNLVALKHLDLSNNWLTSLPKTIGDLKLLENQFKSLSASL